MSRLRVFWFLGLVTAVACHGRDHDGEGQTDHGEGHGHVHGGGEEEPPGQSVTIWTDKNELFMEYDPLIVGRESAFAAHVTVLPTFKAALQGTVSVLVVQTDV